MTTKSFWVKNCTINQCAISVVKDGRGSEVAVQDIVYYIVQVGHNIKESFNF